MDSKILFTSFLKKYPSFKASDPSKINAPYYGDSITEDINIDLE